MKSFFTRNANVSDFPPSLNRPLNPSYSSKWIFSLGLMMAISLLSAGNAWGQTVIAGWDFSPLPGGSNDFGPSPLAATTEDANVSIGGLTRANGIETMGTGAGNAWGGDDFEEGTDLASGISNNNFVTFTITVDAGWALDLDEIEAYNIRRSGTGPTTGQWQYQVGNGSFVNLGSEIIWGGNTSAAGNAQVAIDLSGETALQNISAGTLITFRLVSWSASGSGGTWYINNLGNGALDDFIVSGTVSECTTPPSAGAPFTATTCAGVDVNIDGNPTGGVPAYTHLWTDLGTGTATGVSLVNETSQTVTASASGLSGGTIDLEYKVTDSEGCIGTKTVTVTVNPAPTGSINADINPICFGTTVTFTATPDMLTNYDFKVNGMSVQTSASNTYSTALLEDGWDVSVEATDANGCIADFGTVSMLVYDLPVPAIGAQTNVSCYGASDGSVTITGGDEYKLDVDPYQMSGTFSGLNAGPYTITVRDANQCTATIMVTITEPTILSAMVAATQPTCFGTDDGTITISSPLGGSGDFDYSIDGGTNWTAGLNNTGLAPGTYNVLIRDENEISCVVDLGNQVLAYPTILSATVTATQPTCFGTNDGIITIVSPAGGSGSYDYSIDGGTSWTAGLSNIALAPGTYNVRIRDENHPGCVIDLGNQILAYPAALSATAAATDVTCFGDNDGTITISTQSGGSGSYQYSITGGFTYENSPSYNNLAPGIYNVRMRDMVHQGCFVIINGSLNISQPAILSANVASTQPTCFNTNDGTITISSPAGGSGNFEYSIDGGTSWTAGLNNTNLAPGTYNVQIRDENHPACVIDLGNQTLAYPTILSAMVAATQPTCFGTDDGIITISSQAGGSGDFEYSIDGGMTWAAGLNNPNLAPGTYNVRIRDENHPDCVIDLGNQILTYPTILSATVSATQPTCFGTNDGIITISSPAGGSGFYDYSIDGGTTWTAGLSNIALAPGTYNVRIRDENNPGCVIDLGNQVLAYPAALSATAAATDVTCFGGNDGTIIISNQSGGSGSYQYSINGGFTYENNSSYTSLAPGSYNVRMRDMVHQGCFIIINGSLNITEPTVLSATVNKMDATCFGANDGTITVSAPMGGYGTYEYRLDMGVWQMSGNFAGLAPGVYSVQIRDAAQINCENTLGNQTIAQPNILSATVDKTDVTCFGANDGTITVSAPMGGYGTYEYRLDMGSWQMSSSFTGLAPGIFSVQIRDAAHIACVITLGDQTITEPNLLSATVDKTDATCFGANDGTITVSAPMGGYGTYEYRLDMGSWQLGGSFTGLAPGVYSVQIRDAAHIACVNTLGDQTITEPNLLSATVDKTDATCFGANDGTITVSSPMGGYGTYEYRLDMGSWQGSGIFTGLLPGTYSVQIRDAAQITCEITLGNQTITQPAVLSATVNTTNLTCFGADDGTISVSDPLGGYGTYEYRLDMGSWQGSGSFTGLTPGNYNVQIRDAAHLACIIDLGDQTITEPAQVPVAPITGSNYLYVGGTSQLANATPMGLWETSDAGVASISVSGLVTGNTVGTAIISYTVTDNMNCTNSATLTITVDEPIIDIGLFNFNSPTPAGYNKLKVKIRPIIDVNNANYTSGIFTIRCKSSDNVQFTNADIVSASFGYYLETSALNVDDNGTDYNYFTFFFENAQQYVTWAEDVEVDVLTLRYPCGAASFEIVTNDAWTSANNADYYQELAGAGAERIIYQPTAASPTALSLSETYENILCGEVNTGSIDLSVLTGVTPYAYIWSNGASTEDIMDLAAGTYTVTVTDGNGCTATSVTTIQYLPVTNLTDMPNTYYPSIQAAINAAANYDEIEVCAGTYNENLTVFKPVNLLGANMDEIGCSGRGSESIIAGTGGTAVTIASDEVAINGFTITNPTGSFGVYAKGRNSTTIRYNIITDIGNNVSGTGSTYGVSIEMGSSANIANILIDNNCVHNLRGGQNTALMGLDAKNNNGSAIGIGAGFSTAEYDVTDLRIESNFIYDITASTADWLEGGKGAYGVLINVGAGAGVGKAVNPGVQSNDIHELEGLWAHGIGLEGETENAAVLYNEVYNLIDHKTPSDAEGVRIEDNVDNNIQINQNSFTNIGVGYAGLAINNTETNPVLASCNWYGSTASGVIATRISGNVNYPDWDVIGAVPNPLVAGYVSPPMSCLGSKVVITSVVPDQVICGETTGSLTVTFENDPGPDAVPYDVAWNGPGSPAIGVTSPYTITGLPAGTYTITVTDTYLSTATAMGTVQYLPVANTSDIPVTYYATIQAAIDAVTTENGETLEVCAGTYPEFVTVNKELIIKGPKALIDGCDGSRGTGEAIVVPASAAIDFGEIFHIAASNVTITGFTIDGDNTAITSGFSSTNGADIDAAEGVTVYETGINNLTVTNNVFKNLSYFGVTLYDYPAGVPSSGHLIANNKFQDFGTYDAGSTIEYWGGGVLLYNNQYAAVTDNCMDNLRIGVQTGNFYQANPGLPASQVIDGNTMSNIRRLGVFHNLQYSSASAYTVSDNSISGTSNANETKWNGVLLASLSVPSTTSGNLVNASAVTQPSSGIEVWNVKNTNPASISGGTITDASTGVFLNNFDGYSSDGSDGAHASISSITINTKTSGTGIRVYDNPASSSNSNVQATIGTGVVVNNGARGLVVENPTASIVGATLSNLVFVGQTINYIELIDNAGDLDATAVLFDTETGATASLPENFIIEDKIVHKIDEVALGFVLVRAGEDFVTPQSFTANTLIPSIQRGVDAASNGFIVNVAAGTYTDNVAINKEVSILGAGKALTIVQPLMSDPNCGGMGGGSLCPGASNVMLVQANNVSIQELTIDGDNPGLSGIVVNGADVDARNGIISDYTMGVFNNLLVNNVGVKNIFLRGIYAASGGTFTFSNNMVQNVRGDAGSIGMFNFGGSGTMTNNMVTDCNDGIASNWSTGTTYSGNTVSNSGSGIHTDNNGGSGGVADVISNNTVLNSDVNGYGIWVFAPYVNVQVTDNTVTNVDVGLANAGQFGTVTTSFLRNTVDGMNKANSTGVYQTTDLFGFGTNNVSGIYLNNFIRNNTTGFQVDYQTGNTNTITANNNSVTGNTTGVVLGITAGTLVDDFTCNWWGSSAAAAVAAAVNAAVDYTPWGIDGTDSAPMTNGFQPTPGTCLGTPIMILTAVPDHIICGEASNSGTIEVTFSGGSPTYTVDWGGTPATMLAGSPYTIMGLMAGTYNVTVTDTYGSTTSTMVVVEYLPVTNVSDMPNTYYPSIQAAIDAVTTVNGETIEVCVGIYTENIVVNKSLNILGPQANADADTRFAAFTGGPANPKADPLLEAILTPATNNPTGGNPGANDQIRVLVSGVTINGFVIDGNNPDIAGVSGTQINGVDIDGRRALTNVDNANNVVAINNLNVRHNILQNFGQRAVSLSGAGSLTGNVITENVIRNFLEQGVLLLTNAYVDVTNNTIEVPGSAIGLHLQNFNLNGTMSWTGNNVTVGQDAFGIHANLFYAPLGTLNINNNTVNAASGVTGASDETWGINVWSVSTGANVALNNNIVGNAGGEFGRGINLWNLPTSNTVSITGGTVGKSVIGINLDNIDPYYGAGNNTTVNITGTSVTGGTIGIRARTEVLPVAPLYAANIVAGNTTLHLNDVVVDGAATGIQIKAPAASAPFTATGVLDQDSEVKNGSTAGVAVVGSQAFATIQNNDAAISITGNLIGVEVDGGTATVYRNRLDANGTGIRAINGGNLTSVTENFITNNSSEGVRIEANAGTIGGINFNDISGNTTYSIHNLLATPAVDATCNWYGTDNPNVFDAFIIGGVDYAPYLNAGLDNEALTPGFQPAPMTCVDLTDFYVNDDFTAGDLITTAVGLDGPGTRGTANRPYRHINTAINAAANGNTIRVDVGTYSDEQVLVDKDLTILGTTGSPAAKPIINFTGTPDPMAPLALFRVTYPGVTIHNFEFQPDVSKLGSAIVASDAVNGVSNLTILNNTVNPYRSSGVTVAYSLLNAININYGSHRVNSSNPVNLLVEGNTVAYNVGADMMPGTADDAGFRAGVAVDEGTGTFTANTLQTINQDIEVRFTNTANDVNITNNNINGGGVNFAAPNNGGGNLNITGNTFDGAAGNTYTSSLRVKDNIDAAAMTTLIQNNTFINHNWGISLENYKEVTVNNNTFTPASMSTTFRHITVNTKELNTSSATVTQTDIDGTFTSNKFYGSGVAGGKGMVFLNHDSDDDGYGIFTVGGAGALANEFSSEIAVFMEMDQSSGPSWPSAFPENNLGAGAITTMDCWAEDINIEQNTFDVGAGQQLPINMTGPQRATLETKLYHEPDSACLGLFIYFKPIEVNAKVFLQGPYDTGTNKMADALRQITVGPLFPLSTPYDTMPDFVKVNNYVTETITTAVRDNSDPDNAIVDWVWVELRAAMDADEIVATRSALLQRDGDIVDIDGVSKVQFPDSYEGSYYLMIRHRNHLGAMTAAVVPLDNNSSLIDFSSSSLAVKEPLVGPPVGFNARILLETEAPPVGNVYGLWAGNVNQKDDNGNWWILYNGSQNDRNEVLKRVGTGTPLNIVKGYYHQDVNLNGETKYSGSGNDRVIILNNVGAGTPLKIIRQAPNN